MPKKSQKALTEIANFTLHSDIRSEQRAEFDESVAAAQREAEYQKRLELERKAEMEAAEIKRMRCTEMVFKANPIRKFESKAIAPSAKELTDPMSPCLHTKVADL